MLLGATILAVIAALVVLAEGLPPNIGRVSYNYDPESIVQNERILRLFLKFASETASHLIDLKNRSRINEEFTRLEGPGELGLRMPLPNDDSGQRNGKREREDRAGEAAGSDNVKPEGKAPQNVPGENGGTKMNNHQKELATGLENFPGDGENPGDINSQLIRGTDSAPSAKSKDDSSEGSAEEYFKNVPGGIASRMMLDEEKKTSRNNSDASSVLDAKAGTPDDPNPVDVSGTTDVPRSSDPNALPEKSESGLSFQDAGKPEGEPVTGGMVDQDQDQEGTSEAEASAMALQAAEPAGDLQSGPKDNFNGVPNETTAGYDDGTAGDDALETSANGRPWLNGNVEEEMTSAGQNLSAPMTDQTVGAELSTQNQLEGFSGASTQPAEQEMENEFSGSADPTFTEATTTEPRLNGKAHVTGGLGSSQPIGSKAEGTSLELNVPGTKPIGNPPAGKLSESSVDAAATAISRSPAPGGNPANRLIAKVAGSKKLPAILSSVLNGVKAVGGHSILDSADASKNLVMSSAPHLNQALSTAVGVGNGASAGLTQVARATGPKIVREFQGSALSLAGEPIAGQAGSVINGLAGAGFAAVPLLLDGAKAIPDVGKSIAQADSSFGLNLGNFPGIPEVGSGLIGFLPNFRAFPDDTGSPGGNNAPMSKNITRKQNGVDPQTSPDKMEDPENGNWTGNNGKKTDKPRSQQSQVRLLLLDDDLDNLESDTINRISESELTNFTRQFADALRPLDRDK